jgi:MoxR-like ATPase
METMTMTNKLKCSICGHEAHYLVPHLLEAHGLTEAEYEGEVTSPALETAHDAALKGRKRVAFDAAKGVTARFAGIPLPVNLDVPASECLPLPACYAVPAHGKLADAVKRVAARVAAGNGKPLWLWGPPGTGKDAVFSALSARMRRPARVFNITPDADIQGWLATRALGPDGTYWEEGDLLRALRDGYRTADGRVVPYLIVLSDIDRATRAQQEPLRAILDSLGGRVPAANGMHKVLPGTLVVATANTSGGGDTTGRYTATPTDTSVLDRFTFKVTFTNMDVRDEEPLLRAKYTALAARFPDLIPAVMRATTAIRDAVEKEELFLDFGHRTVSNWMDAAAVEATFYTGKDAAKVIRAGLQDILAGAPNEDTREALKRLVDPHLKGGAVDEGDTSHINNDPLAP